MFLVKVSHCKIHIKHMQKTCKIYTGHMQNLCKTNTKHIQNKCKMHVSCIKRFNIRFIANIVKVVRLQLKSCSIFFSKKIQNYINNKKNKYSKTCNSKFFFYSKNLEFEFVVKAQLHAPNSAFIMTKFPQSFLLNVSTCLLFGQYYYIKYYKVYVLLKVVLLLQ